MDKHTDKEIIYILSRDFIDIYDKIVEYLDDQLEL